MLLSELLAVMSWGNSDPNRNERKHTKAPVKYESAIKGSVAFYGNARKHKNERKHTKTPVKYENT